MQIRGVDLKKTEDTNDEKVVAADEYYRESEKKSSSDWIGPISLGIKINHCYLHRSGSTNFKHFDGGQGHRLGRDCTMPLSRTQRRPKQYAKRNRQRALMTPCRSKDTIVTTLYDGYDAIDISIIINYALLYTTRPVIFIAAFSIK